MDFSKIITTERIQDLIIRGSLAGLEDVIPEAEKYKNNLGEFLKLEAIVRCLEIQEKHPGNEQYHRVYRRLWVLCSLYVARPSDAVIITIESGPVKLPFKRVKWLQARLEEIGVDLSHPLDVDITPEDIGCVDQLLDSIKQDSIAIAKQQKGR